jgi:hypothetical protein
MYPRTPAELAPRESQFEIVRLKLFRPQHGHKQIDQKPDRDNSDDDVFHDLKLSTCVGVKNRDGEKGDGDAHESNVCHFSFPFIRQVFVRST